MKSGGKHVCRITDEIEFFWFWKTLRRLDYSGHGVGGRRMGKTKVVEEGRTVQATLRLMYFIIRALESFVTFK